MIDIVYVCDARPEIGMGHLARGLNVLAEVRRLRPDLIPALSGEHTRSAINYAATRISGRIRRLDETDKSWSSRCVVLDTMMAPGDPVGLDSERVKILSRRSRSLVLVSSSIEVETASAVDVLIDHMPEVRIVGPRPARCHLGLEFAPVAGEFFEIEAIPWEAGDALVAVIGGGPRQTGPEILTELISSNRPRGFPRLEMVVSPHYPEDILEELRRNRPEWIFHRNIPSIAGLLARARAVICTYGNATYESLALARPTFVVGYMGFQERYAAILESKDLVVNCGLFDAPRMESLAALDSAGVLSGLAQNARSIGVGCGARAIARVLCEEVDRVQDA